MRIRIVTSNFQKKNRRKINLDKQKKGFLKYKANVKKTDPDATFENYPFYVFKQKTHLSPKPDYSELIEYLLNKEEVLGSKKLMFETNTFEIPNPFSLTENYSETSIFIKKLFNSLYFQSFETIYIDYSKCENIDVGASMCMDIILSDFIQYYKKMLNSGHLVKVNEIKPIHYDQVKKVLFSIGAFRSIRGFKLTFENVLDFPIIIGSKKNSSISAQREIDITKTVDYIIKCLSNMGKTLTGLAETNLYKVIGEVMQNADDHSDTTNRYSIGYFERTKTDTCDFGIFNLAILNFGNTIYETFKDPKGEPININIVEQMEDLSKRYTSKNFFRQAKFEEETLWTLYALQDGVTRMLDWKRGNGSIRFIESFFNLKGNDQVDDVSKMVITSGHTRIIFDGKYKIVSRQRGAGNETYKMMTFNESGNIEELPDSSYVKYEKNYFPGTMISAKIKIDYENTENL